MSPDVSLVEAGVSARSSSEISVVSTGVEVPAHLGLREELAAGTFAGSTLGERLDAALEHVTGTYVLFVDERVQPSPGAIETLRRGLSDDPTVGAVCAKLVAADGRLLEAGGIVWRDGTVEPYGYGHHPRDPLYGFGRDVDYGSLQCLLVRRSAIGSFDPRLDSPAELGADLCLSLAAAGARVRYEPRAVATIAVGQHPVVADRTGHAPSLETLARLRPTLVGPEPRHPSRRRVLVIGVYLAQRLTNVADVVETLASERHEVVQRWIGLGGSPPGAAVADVTAEVVVDPTPKYVLLNRLLAREDLSRYDTVLVTDDDVVFPEGFVDRYLAIKDDHGFVLAQPARTPNSYIDHPIVQQQPGALARRTLFVEIGPVVSFDRAVYDVVFPHDAENEMGWGFEQVWSRLLEERGLPMGIVDAAPVDHSIRKTAEHYDHERADAQLKAYLEGRPHNELEHCLRVLDVTFAAEGR